MPRKSVSPKAVTPIVDWRTASPYTKDPIIQAWYVTLPDFLKFQANGWIISGQHKRYMRMSIAALFAIALPLVNLNVLIGMADHEFNSLMQYVEQARSATKKAKAKPAAKRQRKAAAA